eukprot:3996723-Amphidinium_carterae.2
MGKKIDRRGIAALKSKVDYMMAKKHPDYYLWHNFLNLVREAEKLWSTSIPVIKDEELKQAIIAMQSENVEFAPSSAYELCSRHAKTHLNDCKWTELLMTLNPWVGPETAEFNPFKPMLMAVTEEPRKKFKLFDELVFDKLVRDLIEKGAEGAERMQQFASVCLDLIAGIDKLDVEGEGVVHMNDTAEILRCLVALSSDDVDATIEVLRKTPRES